MIKKDTTKKDKVDLHNGAKLIEEWTNYWGLIISLEKHCSHWKK